MLPPVYILAGGRSRRFPGDKARASIHGQSQLLRLLGLLDDQGYACTVVADRTDRYIDLGIKCLADIYTDAGPMGGLATGLQDRLERGFGWILLIGCDQFVWKAPWMAGMAALLDSATAPPCTIGLWQARSHPSASSASPIPGLYHTSVLALVHEHCRNGQNALFRLARAVGPNRVWMDRSLARCPSQFSFNSPSELERLLTSQ